jgi:hypothetical protein
MRPRTRLDAFAADLSHWVLDWWNGGCDLHSQPVRWRDRSRWFE